MAELFWEPASLYFAEPRGPGWYVADITGHDILRATYPTKRAAVRAIRLMTLAGRSETQSKESKKAAIL